MCWCVGELLHDQRCEFSDGSFNELHQFIRSLFNPFHSSWLHLILVCVLSHADPPSVTSLTVNGRPVNGSIVINESQEVNISCSYDKGNPPASFRLIDEHATEIKAYGEEQHLIYLVKLQCEQDWPTITCEGNSSEKNISASILVNCK